MYIRGGSNPPDRTKTGKLFLAAVKNIFAFFIFLTQFVRILILMLKVVGSEVYRFREF